MIRGVVSIDGDEYELTPDGWSGGPLAPHLNAAYPPTASPSLGHPVAVAFAKLVRESGGRASVVTAPVVPLVGSRVH